jgi:hypothetical protein
MLFGVVFGDNVPQRRILYVIDRRLSVFVFESCIGTVRQQQSSELDRAMQFSGG